MEAVRYPGPDWGHWGYNMATLPAALHKRMGAGSLGNVLSWVKGNPLRSFEGKAPSYHRVEKALLIMGLALHEMDRVLFTDGDDARKLPDYINNSLMTLMDLGKAMEDATICCRKLASTNLFQSWKTGPIPSQNPLQAGMSVLSGPSHF